MNSNMFESSSSLPSTRSIIDIIADNVESATISTQKQDHSSIKSNTIAAHKSSETPI
ncbi:12260_t:CDS:1, partial [Racocetra fulgida]